MQEAKRHLSYNLYETRERHHIAALEWYRALLKALAARRGKTLEEVDQDLVHHLIDIRHLPYAQLSPEQQLTERRVLAEWELASETVQERKEYDDSIAIGQQRGTLLPFFPTEQVVAMEGLQTFFGQAETAAIMNELHHEYLVDIAHSLGQGKRVCVYPLLPRHYPVLPDPKQDELTDEIMLKYPNRELVVRLLLKSYKKVLGHNLAASEESAIHKLRFLKPIQNVDSPDEILRKVRSSSILLRKKMTKHTPNGDIFSFIPGFLIVKIQVDGQPEYATIMKRVPAVGQLSSSVASFHDHLNSIPKFADKVEQFVEACEQVYHTHRVLPDLVGDGNVLYTQKGNIYLVDINNITPEPDYDSIALLYLIRNLGQESPHINRLITEVCQRYPQLTPEKLHSWIFTPQFNDYDFQQFVKHKLHLVDDLGLPIFLASLDELSRLHILIRQRQLRHWLGVAAQREVSIFKTSPRENLRQLRDYQIIIHPHELNSLNIVGQWDYLLKKVLKKLVSQDQAATTLLRRLDLSPTASRLYDVLYGYEHWNKRKNMRLENDLENHDQGERHWRNEWIRRLYNNLCNDQRTSGLG